MSPLKLVGLAILAVGGALALFGGNRTWPLRLSVGLVAVGASVMILL